MMFRSTFLLSAFVILTVCYGAAGQAVQDSVNTVIIQGDSLAISGDAEIEEITDTLENRPNTAAFYSAALPGLGQAYNGKFWKIPLIYGGGVVVGYYINYNHQLYKQYRDGLFALKDGDDRTTPIYPELDEDDYQRQLDYWRRNRDLLFITAILVYALNIVDAHVDAHMELFTVDDDISLKLEPSISQTAMQTNLIGLSLKLRFN